MKKVNAVARRKSALIFLLLILVILILSPWASAPPPAVPAVPPQTGKAAQTAKPVAKQDPVALLVAAALDISEFEFLQKQNEQQSFQFPDIKVELVRVEPEEAYSSFRSASQVGEAADVMLLSNEWVKTFAASGFLLPADGAFVGDALSEQFDALSAPLKWNGYMWGVPRDFDPYVVVWNLAALRGIMGESAVPPKDLAQWSELAVKSTAAGEGEAGANGGDAGEGTVPWVAMDPGDPLALLAWLQSASGRRTDTLWEKGNPWSGTPLGEALGLLESGSTGVAYVTGSNEMKFMLSSGKTAAAVLPYSEVQELADSYTDTGSETISFDTAAWKTPHAWPRGRSFAVSSRTDTADAAHRWIAVMTEPSRQRDNFRIFGKLPVYRSLFREDANLSALLPESAGPLFPYQAPAELGPDLPVRLERLGGLWSEWSAGRLTKEDWIRRWPETLADFELNG